MDRPVAPPLTRDEQRETLTRLLECQRIARSYAPRLTVAGFQALTYVALLTLDCSHLDLPTNSKIAEAIGVTRPGVSRILASLSPGGRAKGGEEGDSDGYGLVETNDWVGGLRIQAFVLTPKGKECVVRMMSALSGREVEEADFHNLDSLFKLIFLAMKGKK